MNVEQLKKLRAPFPPEQIHTLPKPYKKDSQKGTCKVCGGYHGLPAVHLSYVGHAEVTNRLLEVDPEWSWEPCATDEHGMPLMDSFGGLWIRMTVCGVTRMGYGDAAGKTPSSTAMKEVIGDAIRNAAMRFGVALDLWSKSDAIGFKEAQGAIEVAPEKPKPMALDDVVRAEVAQAQSKDDLNRVWAARQAYGQPLMELLTARAREIEHADA